jgi:hypothetical protein
MESKVINILCSPNIPCCQKNSKETHILVCLYSQTHHCKHCCIFQRHSTNTSHPLHYRQTDIPVVPDCDTTESYAYTAHGNYGCHAPTITLTPNDFNTTFFWNKLLNHANAPASNTPSYSQWQMETTQGFGSTGLLSVRSRSEVRLPGGSKVRTEAHRVTFSYVQCIFCVGWCATRVQLRRLDVLIYYYICINIVLS